MCGTEIHAGGPPARRAARASWKLLYAIAFLANLPTSTASGQAGPSPNLNLGVFGLADVSDAETTLGVGGSGDYRLQGSIWAHADWATSVSGISGLWWGVAGIDWVYRARGVTPVAGAGAGFIGDFDISLSESDFVPYARAGVRHTGETVVLSAYFRLIRGGGTLSQFVVGVGIPLNLH